ncbi:MAG: Hsp20/alpha crystallin family protein [Thermicanus sp.]|nr:Hsp20/alpha crystallin family protein [Thermicanus sp.]
MSMMPYEPFRHLSQIRREMDRFFQLPWNIPWISDTDYFGNVRVDVYETEDEVVVRADIPGVERKEDIQLDLDRDILTMSATIEKESEAAEDQFHRKERFYGRFQRSVPLPSPVKQEGIKASYRNGVLEVRMAKEKDATTRRRINVEFH